MVNRYSRSQQRNYEFYAPPVDAAVQAMQMAQERYNQNYAALEDLKNKYIPSLEADRAQANALQKQWEDAINNVVTNANGDLSSISKEVYSLGKQIQKDLSPGGLGHAIQSNYAAYQDALARNRERLKAGKINAQDLNLLDNYVKTNYQGVGQIDPLTGQYSQINIPELSDYYDVNKSVTDLLTKLPKKKVSETVPTVKDGYITYSTKETEKIDPQEAQKALVGKLYGDNAFMAYATQKAQLMGVDPLQYVQGVVENAATQQLPAFTGEMSYNEALKISGDPVELQRRKLANDWALQKDRQRHQIAMKALEDKKAEMEAAGQNSSNLALVSVSDSSTGRYKPIDEKGLVSNMTAGILTSSPHAGSVFGSSSLMTPASPGTKISFADVMKNPDKYKGTVNTELIKSIEQQYGNTITEGQKRELYNKSLETDVYGKGIYVNQYRTPEAQKRDADVLFPRLATGQVGLWKIDTKTGQVQEVTSSREKKDLYANVYDAEKRKAKQIVIGRTSVQGGNVPYGAYFTDPKTGEAYVLAENEERMNQFNQKERKAAFGYANSDKNIGEPFNLNIGGRNTPVVWEKSYVPDPSTGVMKPQIRYKSVDPKDAADPYLWASDGAGGKSYYTPANIEAAILPQQNLPINKRSGTKDYNTDLEYTPEE